VTPVQRVGAGGRILAGDRHHARPRRVRGEFVPLQPWPVEVMVGAGIGMESHRRTSSGGALSEFPGRASPASRHPPVRSGSASGIAVVQSWAQALFAARAGIESDRGAKIRPGEAGRPAAAVGGDGHQDGAAAVRTSP